jgi:hypothetical protein
MARGSITFNISGGQPPYRAILYNTSETNFGFCGFFNNAGEKTIIISEDIINGTYQLDIVDSNGCVVDGDTRNITLDDQR